MFHVDCNIITRLKERESVVVRKNEKVFRMIRTYGRRDDVEKDKNRWRIRLKTDHEEPWDFQ